MKRLYFSAAAVVRGALMYVCGFGGADTEP